MNNPPPINDGLQVRLIDGDDLETAKQIAARAFNENTQDWYKGQTLAGFDADGTMVCCLDYDPASVWWGTAQIPAGAIGGVATDPKHQGKGHAGGLIVRTIHRLRDEGRCVCPLWPFSFRWYGKFGWGRPTPVSTLRVWPDLVRQIDAPVGVLRDAVVADVPEIDRLYRAGAHTRNGQSVRSTSEWQHEDHLKKVQVLEDTNGGLACSALVRSRDRERGQGRRIVVRELHGDDFAAQLSLVRSLAEWDDVARIDLELPADNLFQHTFAERHDIACEHELGLRVLDVAQALRHLQPSDDLQARISFAVDDWVVDREAPIQVTAQAADGAIEILDRHAADPLRCDIQTFTLLYSGSLTEAQARSLGRLSGGTPAMERDCDALLHGRLPYRSAVESG